MSGRLYVIGTGPGNPAQTTPEALSAVADAQEFYGYGPYLDRLTLRGDQIRHVSDNREELDRAKVALQRAAAGVNVCVVSGGGSGKLTWDGHDDIEENHLRMASQTDQPMAGLLQDLKRRGLLDSTLVLWGGEFGRSPEAESGKGRDHHNLGFSMWLAGGGVKGGQVVGATDAIGLQAIDRPYHLRDVHTTILNQLGLDQNKLTYPHLGRNERLTFVEGKVIKEIV